MRSVWIIGISLGELPGEVRPTFPPAPVALIGVALAVVLDVARSAKSQDRGRVEESRRVGVGVVGFHGAVAAASLALPLIPGEHLQA